MKVWFICACEAPVGPLAWEPPWATGVALKRQKQKNKKQQQQKNRLIDIETNMVTKGVAGVGGGR